MELFFSSFFTDQNLTPILNKNRYGNVTKIPRDDSLLSEQTTEVNGNDPWCKRVSNTSLYGLWVVR